MGIDASQIAADYISYARHDPRNVPEDDSAKGLSLEWLVEDDPAEAWSVIKLVVASYALSEYFSADKKRTEAQVVVGRLAAGPLEDLLSAVGPSLIETVESEAQRDRRMAWALGGVWQFKMTDDIWARVQRAADHSWWDRDTSE